MLTLGVTVGDAAGQVVTAHPWIGLLLPLPAAAVFLTALVRILAQHRAAATRLTARRDVLQ
jgi:hypothetical protein